MFEGIAESSAYSPNATMTGRKPVGSWRPCVFLNHMALLDPTDVFSVSAFLRKLATRPGHFPFASRPSFPSSSRVRSPPFLRSGNALFAAPETSAVSATKRFHPATPQLWNVERNYAHRKMLEIRLFSLESPGIASLAPKGRRKPKGATKQQPLSSFSLHNHYWKLFPFLSHLHTARDKDLNRMLAGV